MVLVIMHAKASIVNTRTNTFMFSGDIYGALTVGLALRNQDVSDSLRSFAEGRGAKV